MSVGWSRYTFEIGQMVEVLAGVPMGARMVGVVVNRGISSRDHKDMYWVLMNGEIGYWSRHFLREVRDGDE
jgi:hypothetical protein